MINKIRPRSYRWLLVMLGMLCGSPAFANGARSAGDQFKMNINISGTVIATGSCSFTHQGEGGVDLVDFGNIRYSTVNGFALEGVYRQPMDSDLTCTGDTDGTAEMTLTPGIGNETVELDGHKLLPITMRGSSAKSKNLGIALLVDGNVQDVGKNFQIDIASPPTLEVELFQTGAADTVTSGTDFFSSASLTMTFQ